MDQGGKSKRKVSPKEKSSFFGKLFFVYTFKTFVTGYRRELEEDDIHHVVSVLKSNKLGDVLEKQWLKDQENGKKRSVLKLILKCYKWQLLGQGLFELTMKGLNVVVIPYATSKLVHYFKPNQTDLSDYDAYLFAAAVISIKLFDCIVMHNFFLIVFELGVKVRTGLCSLMYRKCLKLSPTALSEFTTGKIVTLMTKDVQYIENSFYHLNDVWIAAIVVTIMTTLLYMKVGIAAVIAVGFFVLLLPFQMYIGKKAGDIRIVTCKKTDARIQETQEALSAIKIIKMYTWEKIFAKKISVARKEEVKKLKIVFYLKAFSYCIGHLASQISFFILIVVYLYYGENVEAEVIFYCVSSYIYLKFAIAVTLPHSITAWAELLAATKRINRLLTSENLPPPTIFSGDNIKPKIVLNDVSVRFQDREIVNNITATFKSGLNIVTGTLGSGKSSLLKIILQEYPVTSGKMQVYGTVSYACQDPWLFPSSIKQNILFGEKFDEHRYEKVLKVCALKYDLSILVNGDETIVEDRGMNLSKGQQARINLARAIYKVADIYLLDDCLAALDTQVQAHIFKECIKEFLKGKLCLWVSHNVQSMKEAENVIVMYQGTVKTTTKPSEDIVREIIEQVIDNDNEKKRISLIEENENNEKEDESDNENEKDILLNEEKKFRKNIYHEVKKEGGVNFSVYTNYFKFGGNLIIVFLVVGMFFVDQFSHSFGDKLVSTWTNLEQNLTQLRNKNLENTTEYQEVLAENNATFRLYGIILVAGSMLTLTRECIYYIFTCRASVRIHKAMMGKVAVATMEFFDNTFIGNILNRFSRDLASVDEYLPFIISECFRVTLQITSIFIVIGTVNTSFLIPAAIIFVILLTVRHVYIHAGRSLKRLDSAMRSPVIGHLNATLEGLTTIRAYGTQSIVRYEFDKHQDLFTSAYHMSAYTQRAFACFLNTLTIFFIASIVIRFLFLKESMGGSVGLVLTQAFRLSGILQWAVRQWSMLENQMTCLERVLEYTEVTSETSEGVTKENWPSQGGIKYEKVSLTYEKTNETVLKNINIEIQPKEKIGVVGRTGAGKSSIIGSLFRLYEIGGKIIIDGVDTKTVTLSCLRANISIIPQDPVIFRGTIRTNIDPQALYSDSVIWRALEIVKMKSLINDLNYKIEDTETAFSAGQKQLICLARALVRKNKIIVLDEATANMDPETDLLINDIIKQQFADCTVLTIAHKLDTIMDCDKIIVMDRGEVVEFDHPQALLQKKESIFSKMAKQGS